MAEETKFKNGDKARIVDADGLMEQNVLDPENGDVVTIHGAFPTRNDDGDIVENVWFLIDRKDPKGEPPWIGHAEMFEKI